MAEGLKNIQKQIEQSDKFQDASSFVCGLSLYANEFDPPTTMTLRQLIEKYVDTVEMFIFEKDRIVVLIENKLEVEVISIREANGRFSIQVIKDKKKSTIYVEKKGSVYVYGHGNFEIGSL